MFDAITYVAVKKYADTKFLGFVPQGDYNADTEYKYGDWVSADGGSYGYIYPAPSTGVPLTDTSHWQQIASVGGQDLVDAAEAAMDAAQGYAAQLAAGITSPVGPPYANLSALNTANPDHSKIYLTLDDGNWCYHNGSAFVAGGVYQAASVVGDIASINSRLDANQVYGIPTGNLFNKLLAAIGKYVSYTSGYLSSQPSYFATDFIPVTAGANYYPVYYNLTGFNKLTHITGQQVAFYNSSKVYVSGVLSNAFPIAVPAGCAFMRVSVPLSYIDTVFIGASSELPEFFAPYGKIVSTDTMTNSKVDYDLIDHVVMTGKRTPNITNPNKIVLGRYINYMNGLSASIGGTTVYHTDYINVGTHTKLYVLNGLLEGSTQTAFYDETFTYISGVLDISESGTDIPVGTKWVRITGRRDKPTMMVTFDTPAIEYIPYGAYELDRPTILQVGTGKPYTTLRAAVAACVSPTKYNPYIIEFYGDGTPYDTLGDFTAGEIAEEGFIGLRIPPFTTLRGMGNRDDNILTATMDDIDVSTINLYGSSSMENMTVYGYQCRYTVHDDFGDGTVNNEKRIINCRIVGNNNKVGKPYGAGFRSGDHWVVKDCIFENETGGAVFSAHNNVGFKEPAFLEFENNRFIHPTGSSGYGLSFGSLNINANGIINRVKVVGCELSQIRLIEEDAPRYGAGILFEVTGYANSVSSVVITNTDGVDYSGRDHLI